MSELLDASEIRELAAGIERQQVMDIVRGATFVGTLLLGWISLHPLKASAICRSASPAPERAGDLCDVRGVERADGCIGDAQ